MPHVGPPRVDHSTHLNPVCSHNYPNLHSTSAPSDVLNCMIAVSSIFAVLIFLRSCVTRRFNCSFHFVHRLRCATCSKRSRFTFCSSRSILFSFILLFSLYEQLVAFLLIPVHGGRTQQFDPLTPNMFRRLEHTSRTSIGNRRCRGSRGVCKPIQGLPHWGVWCTRCSQTHPLLMTHLSLAQPPPYRAITPPAGA